MHPSMVISGHNMIITTVTYPANKSRPDFKEELEVKAPDPWVELVSHEEIIHYIA